MAMLDQMLAAEVYPEHSSTQDRRAARAAAAPPYWCTINAAARRISKSWRASKIMPTLVAPQLATACLGVERQLGPIVGDAQV